MWFATTLFIRVPMEDVTNVVFRHVVCEATEMEAA